MEYKKSRKLFLTQEIERLLAEIEEARKNCEDCSKLREELINLIIELDFID